MIADIRAFGQPARDDVFNLEKTTGEFGDNQYWKPASMYDLDDLMNEMDNNA